MMADLFLAAKTAQVESSVNVMDVSVVVITLILILALFFYIRLIHKNTDSVFMDIKKEIDENKKRLRNLEKRCEELQNKFDSMKSTEKASSDSTIEKVPISNKVAEKYVSKQVVTIVKYGDFYMEDNVPVVENRDLSDDKQAGYFMITIQENASTATYTLNKEKLNFNERIMMTKNAATRYNVYSILMLAYKSFGFIDENTFNELNNYFDFDYKTFLSDYLRVVNISADKKVKIIEQFLENKNLEFENLMKEIEKNT